MERKDLCSCSKEGDLVIERCVNCLDKTTKPTHDDLVKMCRECGESTCVMGSCWTKERNNEDNS